MKNCLIYFLWLLLTFQLYGQCPYENFSNKDIYFFGLTATLGFASFYIDKSVQPLTDNQIISLSPDQINTFERCSVYNYSKNLAHLSDIGLYAFLSLPAGLFIDKTIRKDSQNILYLYFETVALAGVLTELTKVTVQRIRPYAFNPEVPVEMKRRKDAKKSFFSGHTSLSFAGSIFFAKVYSDYYPDSRLKPFVWVACLSLASSVGYLRIKAGKHFPTDILAGALIGGLVGYYVPQWHKKSENNKLQTNVNMNSPVLMSLSFSF